MRGRSFACVVTLLAFAAPAHAIPPPQPPSDPAAVIEAAKLAEELLVGFDESGLQYQARVSVCSEAISWLSLIHPDVRDPAVPDAFYAAVFARVDAVWSEERPNIGAAVANHFRYLPAADLVAVRAFIASPAGQNFARTLGGPNFGLADRAATAVLYRRLFPEFAALLAAAQKSAAE